MKEIVEFVDGFRKAMKRALLAVAEAYSRIPAPIREELMWAARERRSIEKYQAIHEAERQAGLAFVRELGAQARRDLGLPEEATSREPMIWHDEGERLEVWGTLDPPDACMCKDCVLGNDEHPGGGA